MKKQSTNEVCYCLVCIGFHFRFVEPLAVHLEVHTPCAMPLTVTPPHFRVRHRRRVVLARVRYRCDGHQAGGSDSAIQLGRPFEMAMMVVVQLLVIPASSQTDGLRSVMDDV